MEVSTKADIKIPGEICPVPSMESMDDESFVVLGSGFDDSIEYSYLQNNDNRILEKIKEEAFANSQSILSHKSMNGSIGNNEEKKSLSKLPSLGNSCSKKYESSIVSQLSSTAASLQTNPFNLENKSQSSDNLSPLQSATALMSTLSIEDQNKLAQENLQLKETIMQNNQSMKLHYEMIEKYKADVKNTFQVNKEKFTELREYAESLKMENNTLKEKLQLLKKEENNHQQQNKNLDAIDKMTLSSSASMTSSRYEFELHLLSEENQKLKREIENFKKLENDNEILRKEIEKFKTINEENIKIKQENGYLHNLQQTNLETINKLTNQYKHHEIAALNIQQHLVMEKDNLFSQLKKSAVVNEELEKLRQQLVCAQQSITIMEMSEREKLLQIVNLQEEIKTLKGYEDDSFALKTQLDMYKSDFEAERQSKETISIERNQIAEDLRNLQRRNQELQDEVQAFRTQHPGSTSLRKSTSKHSAPQPQQKYECPKCMFNWKTLQALENHVERCLDTEDTLP